jgi:hypothetical protein
MKIANIIIAHKNPNQLSRLISQYKGELFHNFVHIDERCDLNGFAQLINHPNVTILQKRRKIRWAGFGFVKVTLDALHLIKNGKEKYFYYNLMSGMDFPIRPTTEFYDFLKTSYHNGCPEYFEILDLSEWSAKHRYELFHLNELTIRGRYFLERIINWFVPKRKFYGGKFTPYGRSAWFTASHRFIDYALHFIKENTGYLRFLKTTWSPDEFIFNSLIMNSPFKDKVTKQNLRHINWSEGNVHPKIFTDEDFDELILSGKFIARKFDEEINKTIIDRIEAKISE